MNKWDIAEKLSKLGYDMVTELEESHRIITEAKQWEIGTTHTFYERITGTPLITITKR